MEDLVVEVHVAMVQGGDSCLHPLRVGIWNTGHREPLCRALCRSGLEPSTLTSRGRCRLGGPDQSGFSLLELEAHTSP